jgi:hypothetical protein
MVCACLCARACVYSALVDGAVYCLDDVLRAGSGGPEPKNSGRRVRVALEVRATAICKTIDQLIDTLEFH